MVSQRNLSNRKYLQVSRTLLSILADLNNPIVWMVSTRPIISDSSIPLTKTFGIVPNESVTIGITVIFLFHSCFSPLARSKELTLHSDFN